MVYWGWNSNCADCLWCATVRVVTVLTIYGALGVQVVTYNGKCTWYRYLCRDMACFERNFYT